MSSLEKSGNYGAGAHGLSQVLDYQKTWLAEHHIYGSSRLGLQQYWGDRYGWLWTGGQTAAQNGAAWTGSQLAMARPWYSRGFEGMVSAGQTSAWGNGNSSQILSARLLGTRRYELTDHLGDVAAVVADKPVDAADPDHAGLILRRAALTAAYDHYPFGMLMPGRYVEDATGQCTPVTVSRTAVSYQEMGTLGVVRTPWDGGVAGLTAGRSPAGGGQVMPDEDWVIAPGNPVALDAARVYHIFDGVDVNRDEALWEVYGNRRDMPQVFSDVNDLRGWLQEEGMIEWNGEQWHLRELNAGRLAGIGTVSLEKGAATGDGYVWPVLSAGAQGVAGAPYRVQVQVGKEMDGDWELQLWDRDSSGVMRLLSGKGLSNGELAEIEGVSLSGSNVVAALTYVGGGDRRKMAKVGIVRDENGVAGVKAGYPVWVTTTETVLSCSGDGFGGDYRFGFNGQMKVNEVAGVGNHNTALFWEYDTRLGRRWNTDPIIHPWESPYLALGGNPIQYADLLGNDKTETSTNKKGDKITTTTCDDGTPLEIKVTATRIKKIDDCGNYQTYSKDGKSQGFYFSQEKHDEWFNKWVKQQEGNWLKEIFSDPFPHPENAADAWFYSALYESSWETTTDACFAGSGMVDEAALPPGVQHWTGLGGEASAGNGGSRAFWSGAGSEAKALEQGFGTLGQTRAGQNLIKLTESMPYYPAMNGQPASQAYQWWARLSTQYAKGASGTIHVFQNPTQGVGMQSIWRLYEYPTLIKNPNVTRINYHF